MTTKTTTPSETFWSPAGRITRGTYTARLLGLIALAVGTVAIVGDAPSMVGGLILIAAVVLTFFQALKRSRDGFGHATYGWLCLMLPITGFLLILLALKGTAPDPHAVGVPR